MESFVRDSMMQHLKQNDLLSNQQYGFISGRSTGLQLLNVMNKLTSVLAEGGQINVVYMDFKKAFDTALIGACGNKRLAPLRLVRLRLFSFPELPEQFHTR